MIDFITPYNGKVKKVVQDFFEPSLTDQSCKDECDIGFIIENFVRTGQMPEQPQMNYIDCTSVQSFEEASLLVAQCKSDFELLPAAERDKFKTVQGWLSYVNNPDNLKDCIEKGYINKDTVDKKVLDSIFNDNQYKKDVLGIKIDDVVKKDVVEPVSGENDSVSANS